MLSIRRGTTPSITFRLRMDQEVQEAFNELLITIKQPTYYYPEINRTIDTLDDEIQIMLTQEETLSLRAGVETQLQLKLRYGDEYVIATRMYAIEVEDVLNEVLMHDGT